MITAFSSDGRIAALDLVTLADPRRALPSYDAVLLVSPDARQRPRGCVAALRPLIGAIPVERMRAGQSDGRPRRRQADAGRGGALAAGGRSTILRMLSGDVGAYVFDFDKAIPDDRSRDCAEAQLRDLR